MILKRPSTIHAGFTAPRPVRPGARLAIVAPSSPFPREDFEEGVARLRRRYDVRVPEGIHARTGYLAGDDARRLDELLAALDDPDTDAILAARGGYGATRLLPSLPLDRIAKAQKLLVGFSDVTALHAAWARAGLRSLHGPMVASLGRASEPAVDAFFAALEGARPRFDGLTPIARGRAEGPLVGGNLAVLAALVGTKHEPPLDGAILFLEDTGERPYRVDRMLTTLEQAGWLARVRGVALGAFTDAAAGADGTSVDEVLRERLGRLAVPVPVVAGVPAGHVDDNAALLFGAPVALDADRGTLQPLD